MQKELFLSLLAKYKNNTLSQDEWTTFREQVQTATYDELLQLDVDQLMAVRQVHPSWSSEKEDKMWDEIQLHGKVRRIRSFTRWMAAAAVVVIGLLAWWLLIVKPRPEIYTAKAGERKTVELPDGSKVKLNSGSTLTVAPYYNEENRVVLLDGEGFFEVKHDRRKPFILRTAGMQVIDMGTVFNVRAYSNEKEEVASLVSGKIKVVPEKKSGNPSPHILLPYQKLVVLKAVMPAGKTAGPNDTAVVVRDTIKGTGQHRIIEETAWTDNRLIFNNTTMREVAAAIGKWYGMEVEFEKPSLQEVLISGEFKANDSVSAMMDVLKYAVPDLRYRINGKKLVFY